MHRSASEAEPQKRRILSRYISSSRCACFRCRVSVAGSEFRTPRSLRGAFCFSGSYCRDPVGAFQKRSGRRSDATRRSLASLPWRPPFRGGQQADLNDILRAPEPWPDVVGASVARTVGDLGGVANGKARAQRSNVLGICRPRFRLPCELHVHHLPATRCADIVVHDGLASKEVSRIAAR